MTFCAGLDTETVVAVSADLADFGLPVDIDDKRVNMPRSIRQDLFVIDQAANAVSRASIRRV